VVGVAVAMNSTSLSTTAAPSTAPSAAGRCEESSGGESFGRRVGDGLLDADVVRGECCGEGRWWGVAAAALGASEGESLESWSGGAGRTTPPSVDAMFDAVADSRGQFAGGWVGWAALGEGPGLVGWYGRWPIHLSIMVCSGRAERSSGRQWRGSLSPRGGGQSPRHRRRRRRRVEAVWMNVDRPGRCRVWLSDD
jgi:hypothetical protein